MQAKDSADIVNEIVIDLGNAPSVRDKGYISLSELLMLDIIATNAAEGWPRPIYWCSTVGDEYHLGLTKYMRGVGMTHQLVPTIQEGLPARTDRAYDVVTKYRWGGADNPKAPYFDETARRMLISTRSSMLDVSSELVFEGDQLAKAGDTKGAEEKYRKALQVARLLQKYLPESTAEYSVAISLTLPEVIGSVGEKLNDRKLKAEAATMLLSEMDRMAQYITYNREVASRFRNPSLTTESRLMPYQFYRYIELYDRFGGNPQKLEQLLQKHHLSRQELKQNYDALYNAPYSTDEGETYTEADYVAELAQVAATVYRLQGMDAATYGQQSADDRYLDSIFYEAMQQYIEAGVSKDAVMGNPDIRKVNLERSKRLSEEYKAKHQ